MKNIAVIFGGKSSEYEISLLSASFVIENIDRSKYNVICLGISKNGEWILYTGDTESIKNGNWINHPNNVSAFIGPDTAMKGMVAFYPDKTQFIPLDVVFPVLHGKNGEDGTIQGLLSLSSIPFVGCDTTSSAVCMDKVYTHALLNAAGVAQAKYIWFYEDTFKANPQAVKERVSKKFSYPVFVKPSSAGSSIGVSKVNSEDELETAILKAAKEDVKILVEEAIIGREVEVAVLGGRDAIASPVGEIVTGAQFYDYDDKYKNGVSQTLIPQDIEQSDKLRETAIRAYKFLGCSGLSRVDFFLKDDGSFVLNEINTLPGFTGISMYPKLWQHTGLTATDLISKIIDTAFNRYG